MPTLFPQHAHTIPTTCPHYSHNMPTLFPQHAHTILTICPHYSHNMPTLFPQHAHTIPTTCPHYSHNMPTLFPQHAHTTYSHNKCPQYSPTIQSILECFCFVFSVGSTVGVGKRRLSVPLPKDPGQGLIGSVYTHWWHMGRNGNKV